MKSLSISKAFAYPPYRDLGAPLTLRPLLPEPAGEGDPFDAWEAETRPRLWREWTELLGQPVGESENREAEKVAEWRDDELVATYYWQPTTHGLRQKVIVLRPPEGTGGPMPAAVVPFYQPQDAAGVPAFGAWDQPFTLEGQSWKADSRQYGRHLVRLGFTVACVEAYPFNLISDEEAPRDETLDRWRIAAEKWAHLAPGWTGLGKLVYDTRRAIDLLLEQPGVDPQRVLAIGHSLGGKMAFYTGTFDPRVTAVIGSDFGLSWASTNWDAPWYLGARRPSEESGMAHHELLALLAPRPFFLIAGETDNRRSWQILNAARPIYAMHGHPERLGGIDHASGHQPQEASLDIAYAWLAEQFFLPHRRWRR